MDLWTSIRSHTSDGVSPQFASTRPWRCHKILQQIYDYVFDGSQILRQSLSAVPWISVIFSWTFPQNEGLLIPPRWGIMGAFRSGGGWIACVAPSDVATNSFRASISKHLRCPNHGCHRACTWRLGRSGQQTGHFWAIFGLG